jgi:nucleoid-associated protein EbfC
MGSGYSKMKKQAKAMQEQYDRMQEELKNKKIDGSAGNGLVKVIINGEKEILDLKINPDCVDRDDLEGLQDLIIAAVNDAGKKVDEDSQNTPGAGGLPFNF